jgi:hypothetical protein
MATRPLDLNGLPEPVARGFEVMAEMARRLSGSQTRPKRRTRVKLTPVKGGKVLTSLSREDIYADDNE